MEIRLSIFRQFIGGSSLIDSEGDNAQPGMECKAPKNILKDEFVKGGWEIKAGRKKNWEEGFRLGTR